MKTKLIIGSFLALAGVLTAQGPDWAGAANTTGAIYRSGRIGIGNVTSPIDNVHVRTNIVNGGLYVDQYYLGAASLTLKNSTPGGLGRTWMVASTGDNNAQGEGNFDIVDFGVGSSGGTSYGSISRLFIKGTTGFVGMGTTSPNRARLHAILNAADILSDPTGDYTGIKGYVYSSYANPSQNAFLFGVSGTADGIGKRNLPIGVYGEAKNGAQNMGGSFLATGVGEDGTGNENYGVRAEANSVVTNYGRNCGIWATASGALTNWAGYFSGNIYCVGSYMSSDQKLKKNIKPIENSIEKLKLLNPSSYNFRTDEFKVLDLPEGNQLGLIAQELEKVFPELIKDIAESTRRDVNGKVVKVDGFKSVNYIGLIPVLIGGVKEQQTQIENLSAAIAQQKAMIDALINKAGTSTGINEINTVPSGFNMDQNVPNPFNNETVIKYTLPNTVGNASLVVYELSGKQVISFPLTDKGTSSITITSEKLAAGIYLYSVMADGKIIDTKRMVVANK